METRFILIIGVSGSGKTSVGQALASELGWEFFDADDFHPPENLVKMKSGQPLNDADRAPWLDSLHALISTTTKPGKHGVLACSALKEYYRRQLLQETDGVRIIYLKGDYSTIWPRMAARHGHFMKPEMLQSQFDTLEEPADALVMDVSLSLEVIVQKVLENLGIKR